MNNNEFGKCHLDSYSDHYSLLNVPHLMNYIWGKYDDFIQRLVQGKIINGCDNQIIHAKFNNGKKPKASIFHYNQRTQALVANEYVSYDDLSLITRFLCGGNQRDPLARQLNETNNSVIQSFSIVDVSVFEFLK